MSNAPVLIPGEPAPWFHAPALDANPRFAFDTVAGRWIVLLFLGDGASDAGQAALGLVADNRDLFDDKSACFFGVTSDPADAPAGRIAISLPGVRWFLDYDRRIADLYGVASVATPHWVLVDPMMRVAGFGGAEAGAKLIERVRAVQGRAPTVPAPVLIVPNLFEPALCQHLIETYDTRGGRESGFMREVDGVTRLVHDHNHKRRSDYSLEDEALIDGIRFRIQRILRPLVRRAFQFDATRIERWIVARYDAEVGGYFRPHRDNTTKGTAHRRFAVTINLDTSRYEGGDLRFPEFGMQTYRAPSGGAVVFSCSLLHEALPVTSGARYAFLPFLYDDEAARIREANLTHVEPDLQGYRSGLT